MQQYLSYQSIKGKCMLDLVLAEIEASHRYCNSKDVPRSLKKPRNIISNELLISKLESNKRTLEIINQVVVPIFENIYHDYILIFCDSDLIILKVLVLNEKNNSFLNEMGISSGKILTEESCRTNALSLTKKLKKTVAVNGEEHYCDLLNDLNCIAGPLKDITGNILGYICLTKPKHQKFDDSFEIFNTITSIIKNSFALIEEYPVKQPLFVGLPSELLYRLAPREREICLLMLKGYSSKEIAAKLSITVSTVSTYRKYIYQKLDVTGFTGLLSKISHYSEL